MTTTTAPRMTEDHVRALLALLVSLDGRLRASDENSPRSGPGPGPRC
jgi:hypothetical protein